MLRKEESDAMLYLCPRPEPLLFKNTIDIALSVEHSNHAYQTLSRTR